MSQISFKNLTQDDVTTSRTLMHESIPITGSLISGTYNVVASTGREQNIKTFSHGMFQSVYDYPYASSSANQIFDITAGYTTSSAFYDSVVAQTQASKKVNIYNQMAMMLAGYDSNGNINRFAFNGTFPSGGTAEETMVFLNFSRLLAKDEIKKGSFSMRIMSGSAYATPHSSIFTATDAASSTNYRSNSPAGEYGFIKDGGKTIGLIFYQAGIVALDGGLWGSSTVMSGTGTQEAHNYTSGTIDQIADSWRNRIQNISFNNTTELNSTIYFCRAKANDFNYSSNPTYLSGSKIRVKTIPGGGNEFANMPMSYVTTVGLYSPDNELLAVAKLSEPVKKTPINELNLRVRLDY